MAALLPFLLFMAFFVIKLSWYLIIKPAFYIITFISLQILKIIVMIGHEVKSKVSVSLQKRSNRKYMQEVKEKGREDFWDEENEYDQLYIACGYNPTRYAVALQKKLEQENLVRSPYSY